MVGFKVISAVLTAPAFGLSSQHNPFSSPIKNQQDVLADWRMACLDTPEKKEIDRITAIMKTPEKNEVFEQIYENIFVHKYMKTPEKNVKTPEKNEVFEQENEDTTPLKNISGTEFTSTADSKNLAKSLRLQESSQEKPAQNLKTNQNTEGISLTKSLTLPLNKQHQKDAAKNSDQPQNNQGNQKTPNKMKFKKCQNGQQNQELFLKDIHKHHQTAIIHKHDQLPLKIKIKNLNKKQCSPKAPDDHIQRNKKSSVTLSE